MSIAVDWVSDNIYIIEGSTVRIDMVNIATKKQKTLVGNFMSDLQDIAVDPIEG